MFLWELLLLSLLITSIIFPLLFEKDPVSPSCFALCFVPQCILFEDQLPTKGVIHSDIIKR